MNRLLRLAGAVGLVLVLAATAARAAGDDDTPENKDLAAAKELIDKWDYAKAIPLLEKVVVAEPKNADAYNYLGYSHRKLGDREKALVFYRKALEIKPRHLGANEYLGELYLEMGELQKAEERLAVLDKACFFGCDEYSDLKEAIEAYKKQAGG